MIWIRADANHMIGSGHVMRCLSIAGELKKLGEKVCFLTADEEPLPLLKARRQEFLVLHSDYRNPEEELERLEELLKEHRPDFFLADSYYVTGAYLEGVRRLVPAGYLDDLGRDFGANLLINYNLFAGDFTYEKVPGDRRLLGVEYVPLREEFSGVRYLVRERASRVLVTTGGSDEYNLAGQLLEKALAAPPASELEYWVASGAYNQHLENLENMAARHPNVRIYSNVSNMQQLMKECDIAVSAGGSTLYELSAVGVPTVCFSFVENQERIVECFREKGLSCCAGNYCTQGTDMLDGITDSIVRLKEDAGLRRSFSEKMRSLVDGQGAARIAERLAAGRRDA